MNDNIDSIDKLLYGEDALPSSSAPAPVIMMEADKPTEEGCYFVQYHKNFQPVFCDIIKDEWGDLWLQTKTTMKPLKDIKAYCYGRL